jgi:drug/metabolite transporter (DMT)-like permease
MNPAMAGYIVGAMLISLLLPIVWLLIARVIPSIRARVGLAYGIAMVLAWPTAFLRPQVDPGDPITSPDLLLGSLLGTAALYFLMLRAKKKTGVDTAQGSK